MLVRHPWSNLLLNIDFHWLVWISHITWRQPPIIPLTYHEFRNSVGKWIGFRIINKEEKQQKKERKHQKSDVVHFLSHHTHRFFLGQRCVKWSVKWVHLTSLQWIIRIILHWGSRASCLSPGNLSSTHTHLYSSHFVVHCVPEFVCHATSSRSERDNVFK